MTTILLWLWMKVVPWSNDPGWKMFLNPAGSELPLIPHYEMRHKLYERSGGKSLIEVAKNVKEIRQSKFYKIERWKLNSLIIKLRDVNYSFFIDLVLVHLMLDPKSKRAPRTHPHMTSRSSWAQKMLSWRESSFLSLPHTRWPLIITTGCMTLLYPTSTSTLPWLQLKSPMNQEKPDQK